jgi:hypothetical protein
MSDKPDDKQLAALIDQISIWGRLAFGITCLERLCTAWSIREAEGIRSVIDTLWSFRDFLAQGRLDLWDSKCRETLPDFVSQIPALTDNAHLTGDQQTTLLDAITVVWEIGSGNLYSAFQSYITRTSTLDAMRIMRANGIDMPDLRNYLKAPASEDPWGVPYPPEIFSVPLSGDDK